jgi:hypothetical protein
MTRQYKNPCFIFENCCGTKQNKSKITVDGKKVQKCVSQENQRITFSPMHNLKIKNKKFHFLIDYTHPQVPFSPSMVLTFLHPSLPLLYLKLFVLYNYYQNNKENQKLSREVN